MSERVGLITDSTSDVPPELLEEYGVRVASQYVIFGEEQLRDRVEIQPKEFYERAESGPYHPTTSHPTPGDYVPLYQQVVDEGAEEIVVVTLSDELSGSYGSARQAAEDAGVPVHVVDSRSVTMGLGWQLLAAARARELGGGVSEMLAAIERVRQRISVFVCLDTVEYLRKGGRIGLASAMVGAMLNIKPLVWVNPASGLVEPLARVRSRRRSIDTLYQRFRDAVDVTKPLRVAVLHGQALAEARALADRIKSELHPVELLLNETGPVLGVHTGPRALALCGYWE